MTTGNYVVTLRLAQGEGKPVNLAEDGNLPVGGVALKDVIQRGILGGWQDDKQYQVDGEPATANTLLFGGETVTLVKRHDNG